MKEEKQFQTESKQLLDLMINSIYSNREIFLRELISNGSDAIDKYRFLSLTDGKAYPAKDYLIRLEADKKQRTLSVSDNGIGMSKEEMEQNLGTIAKSGSKDFAAKFKQAKEAHDLSIIGQFGVGFYSAFMVADKVEVYSKALGQPAYKFVSDGRETYSIEDAEFPEESGSKVIVYLKQDSEDINYSSFLETWKIEELVRKYSDYVRYPIKMLEIHTEPEKDENGKAIEGKSKEVSEDKTLNSMVPLWKKSNAEVDEKALAEFYKNKFDDFEEPLLSLKLRVEGLVSYDALLFIPAHAPYNLYSENYERGLSLYSKGIFIQERCKELIPQYLKFVQGLVDSDDFPLNISREMLQHSPAMSKIASSVEKKLVDKLKAVAKAEPEKYEKFFSLYGDYIKFGIYSTYGMKTEELKDLLLFHHSTEDKLISLKAYVEALKPEQKDIYYASGKTLAEAKLLPQLEKFRKEGKDVLLLDREIDEFCLMAMNEYDKHPFKNISSVATEDVSQEEKDKLATLTATHKRILDDLKEALQGKVDDVSFSSKLIDSPVCITTKDGLSLNMEKVLEAQPGAENSPDAPKATKVLEINAESPLFAAIAKLGSDEEVKKYGTLLYNEALLLEGFDIEDKKEFVASLNELLIKTAK